MPTLFGDGLFGDDTFGGATGTGYGSGAYGAGAYGGAASGLIYTKTGAAAAATKAAGVRVSVGGQPPPPPAGPVRPTVTGEISFTTNPLATPAYVDVSAYLREVSTLRGRNFEYDRMETGTADFVLDNRDSRFNPENTSSPYYANLKPTRRCRFRATWAATLYDLIVAFTKGYPQEFPHTGFDALVRQKASDPFYPLNMIKFRPSPYLLPQQYSGARIQSCLEAAGMAPTNWVLSPGQSLIAASEDLAGQNVLEHILLVAEAENGRVFAAKDGRIVFRDRHWHIQNEQTARATFGVTAPQIPYTLDGPVEHDETKLYNVVRITPASGNTQTASDQTSIDAHFERVLEKQWPLVDDNEAKSAAEYMLAKQKDMTLRVPRLTVQGETNPSVIWPVVLDMEVGHRYSFTYPPRGGGTAITREVIAEGIQHQISPDTHRVALQLSPADTTTYWRLGVVGYSELGTTTRLAY